MHTAANEFLHKIELNIKVNGCDSQSVAPSFEEFQARFCYTKVK